MAGETRKTWLVAGAASGLARELVEQVLARGDRVAAASRDPRALAELQLRHPGQLWTVGFNLADRDGICRAVDGAFDHFGRIDVVLSNPGEGLCGAAEEVSDHQIRRIVEVGMVGPIQFVRCALGRLREQGFGHILQLSGFVALPGFSLQNAAAGGVERFIEALALETQEFGIACTLVQAGAGWRDFGENALAFSDGMEAYERNGVGRVRAHFLEQASRGGDVASAWKMVEAIIATADQPSPPRRLTLGCDAWSVVHMRLTERLEELQAQSEMARLTSDHDAHGLVGIGAR
jgi:NAD(P)-dependent dehydrogenase (short-subunit alcohol dehydrogenase family)